MLRHVGRNNPLVLVFAGMCCSIVAMHHDGPGLCFGLFLGAMLITKERIPHALLGVLLGFMAFTMGPGWEDIAEGVYKVSGEVDRTEYAHGMFRVVLGNVDIDGRSVRGKALVTVSETVTGLVKGSRLSLGVRVRQPRRNGNSGEFDYQHYLLSRNIVLTGYAESGSEALDTGGSDSPPGQREELIRFLNRYSRPEAELVKAIVLGDRSGITHSLRDRFNALGISHLIAISGLHIGITMLLGYGLIFCILRIMPPLALRTDAPLLSRIGAVGAALVYTWFIGPEVTVLRSCIMAVSCAACLISLRKYDLIGGLSLAGILILIIWPEALFSASFQLSFCAVLGIGGLVEKTKGSPPLFTWLLITPAAGVFTLPVAVYLFGFVSCVSLPANCFIVPFFGTVIMPLSILGILIHLICPALSGPVFTLSMKALHILLAMSDLLGSQHPVARPWVSWVYISYTALIIAFWGARSRVRPIVLAVAAAILILLPILKHTIENGGNTKFDFISVGQGDCSLISQGRHAVLIDAGPAYGVFDAGRYIIAPHLLRRGRTSLDVMVITHLHPDHCGGAPFILERFRVGELWLNARQTNNQYFQEVMRITKEKSIPLKYVCRGDRLRVGSMIVDVLNPRNRLIDFDGPVDQNLQSVVLRVHDGLMTGLFMGDADMFGELTLVHTNEDISADILKVAHHGSEKSCLNPFLEVVKPDVAVISCGYRNVYGNPAQGTLQRLRTHGVRVFRTDMHGETLITSGPEGIAVKSVLIPADNH